MSPKAQTKPKMYDTAYHLKAKCIPKKSKEKMSGLILGNGIMLLPKVSLLQVLKTRITHNARVTVGRLFSGVTKLIQH